MSSTRNPRSGVSDSDSSVVNRPTPPPEAPFDTMRTTPPSLGRSPALAASSAHAISGVSAPTSLRTASAVDSDIDSLDALLAEETEGSREFQTYDAVHGAIAVDADIPEALLLKLAEYAGNSEMHGKDPRIVTFSILGERPVVRAAAIVDLFSLYCEQNSLPNPTVFFYGSTLSLDEVSGTKHVPDELLRMCRDWHSSSITSGKVSVNDTFLKIYNRPRNHGYTDIKIESKQGFSTSDGKSAEMNILASFSRKVSIEVGGARKYYGRESEMRIQQDYLGKFFKSGRFDSLTVEAPALAGKSRNALELEKFIRQNSPESLCVKIPAMDFQKNGPLSFASLFLHTLLSQVGSVATLRHAPEFQMLLAFMRQPSSARKRDAIGALTNFLKRVAGSGISLVFFLDDAQWIDPESANFLSQVFRDNSEFSNIFAVFLARTGDEVISEDLVDASGITPEKRVRFAPMRFLDTEGRPLKFFREFVGDVLGVANPTKTYIDEGVLIKLAKLSDGNPGFLTSLLYDMHDAKVFSVDGDRVMVTDSDAFAQWEGAGMVESVIKNEIDRLAAMPGAHEALRYVIAFLEHGDIAWSMLSVFCDAFLKRPDLSQALISLQSKNIISRAGGGQDFMFFPRQKFQQMFKQLSLKKDMENAYSTVARFAHGVRHNANRQFGGNEADLRAYFQQPGVAFAHPLSVYRCAEKGGHKELMNAYALEAFEEAHTAKNYEAMLSLYTAIMSNPELRVRIPDPVAFDMKALEAMSVGGSFIDMGKFDAKGKYSAGRAEKLAEKLATQLGRNFSADHQLAPLRRLSELMIDMYYRRTIYGQSYSNDGVPKMQQWVELYNGFIMGVDSFLKSQAANGSLSADSAETRSLLAEKIINDIWMKFNSARYLFMQGKYMDAKSHFADALNFSLASTIQPNEDMGLIQNDPRYVRIRMEAQRMLATVLFNGYRNVFIDNIGGDGSGSFDDEHTCEYIVHADRESPMYATLQEALEHYRAFLQQANARPDLLYSRNRIDLAWQGAGRAAHLVGNYSESSTHLREARSLAIKNNNSINFGTYTMNLGAMLKALAGRIMREPKNTALVEEGRAILISLSTDHATLAKTAYSSQGQITALLDWADYYLDQACEILKSAGTPVCHVAFLNSVESFMERLEATKRVLTTDFEPYAQKRVVPFVIEFMEQVKAMEETLRGWGPAYWDMYGAVVAARFGNCIHELAQNGLINRDVFTEFADGVLYDKRSERFMAQDSATGARDAHSVDHVTLGDRFTQPFALLYRELLKPDRGTHAAYDVAIRQKIEDLGEFVDAATGFDRKASAAS